MDWVSLLNIGSFQPERLRFPDAWIGHIPFAAWLIQTLKPSVFVELGTHSGNSYFAFCQAVREGHLTTRCFAVDTWKGDEHAGYYGEEVFEDVYHYNEQKYSQFSRLLRMTFDEATSYFPDNTIDLLHIDGMHTYESVKHDFETWLPKLSNHAIVLFHDTNVRERNFGVWKLWQELCERFPLNFEFFHSHGLGVLLVSKEDSDYDDKLDSQLSWLSRDFPYNQLVREYFSALGMSVREKYLKQDLEIKFHDAEHVIETLRAELSASRERAAGLEAQLAEREQHNTAVNLQRAALQQEVDALRSRYETLQQYHQEREQILQNLNNTLLEIYSSTAWKVIRWMWRVRLWLAPKGSLREKVGRRVFAFFLSNKTNKLTPKPRIDSSLSKQDIETVGETTIECGLDYKDAESPYRKLYEQIFSISKRLKSPDFVEISDTDLTNAELLVRLIAFYLPQYHPIPENDMWWGKGFTEWTNVTRAVPLFLGHYQPHLPGELGFYDLRVKEVQERQVELAKKYGIYGFCFYYYSFKGKKLLDLPLREFMENDRINFPFCIMWVNENWTRRWDGLEHEILIAQDDSEEEISHLIKEILPIITHKNYIKLNGRPVILIYNPRKITNPQKIIDKWREVCITNKLNPPYIIAAQTFGHQGNLFEEGYDGLVEFPPHLFSTDVYPASKPCVDILCDQFNGKVFYYSDLVNFYVSKDVLNPNIFKTVVPMWDNTARKSNNATIFVDSTPDLFGNWLHQVIKQTLRTKENIDERLIFINAWNEWAEGSHLEPDQKYGYAYLQRIANELMFFTNQSNWGKIVLFISHDGHRAGAQKSLLGIVKWLKEHSRIIPKVLFLQDGNLVNEFCKHVDTLVLPLESRDEQNWLTEIITFCNGLPNLVYGNTTVSTKAYPRLRRLGVPILTHVRELQSSIQKYSPYWKNNLKEKDFFISVSQAVKENLEKEYGVLGENNTVVYNFVSTNEFPILSKAEKVELRQKLNLKPEGVLIVGCGVGMPYRKGIDIFYEVASELFDMGYDNFHFYWIGGNFDLEDVDEKGITWEIKKKDFESKNLQNFVTVLGVKENVIEYFCAADIFILTSREEPFARVVLEAASVGLPTISFEKGIGSAEFIQQESGFVVSEFNPRAMAEKVAILLQDEKLRFELGKNAQNRIKNAFTEQAIMPQILSIIRKVSETAPFVSVIIPNYNHAKYLPKRLESVFNQTFRDFEVILMDDNSTDESMKILEQYISIPDVTLITNEVNSGSPFKQWLKAFNMIRGEVVWIAESDDWCEPTFLEKLLPAFEDSQVGMAYCASKFVDEDDNIRGDYRDTGYLRGISETRWNNSYTIWGQREVAEAMGIKNTILNISSVLFRKFEINDVIEKTLTNMHVGGDTYLLLNILKKFKISYVAEALNYHRRHKKSIVGKILHNTDEELLHRHFGDFYTNVHFTIENFDLSWDYYQKLDKYIHEMWNTLQPGRRFDDIEKYFPYEKTMISLREKLSCNSDPIYEGNRKKYSGLSDEDWFEL